MNYTGKECLQEFFLKKFLEEKGYVDVKYIKIDHQQGTAIIDDKYIAKTIIFPQYLISYTRQYYYLDKTLDYYFKGMITANRQWILQYDKKNTILEHSTYGRNIKLKYQIDNDYYYNMSRSKFVLCPIGDCNWSYRFFEAIICGAIPVLKDCYSDIFCKNYLFYTTESQHIYTKNIADYNYSVFVKNNQILKL
jgi:hypothetical protein